MKKETLFFISLFPFLLFTYLTFFSFPLVWPDEALFLDSAFNLSQTGQIKTNLLTGLLPQAENYVYWTPPFIYIFFAFILKIISFDIFKARLLIFGLSLIFLYISFHILAKITKKQYLIFLGMLLISSDVWFLQVSHLVRMEIFVLLFTILTFHLIPKKNYYLAGFFAFLAIFSHPMGAIAIIAGSVSIFLHSENNIRLFTNRRINIKSLKVRVINTMSFLIPMVIPIFLYFLSITSKLKIYISQNNLQLLRKSALSPYAFLLMRSQKEYLLLFAIFLAITFMGTIYYYRCKNEYFPTTLVFALTSILLLFAGKEMWYLVYFQPYVALLAINLITTANNNIKKAMLIVILIAITLNIKLTHEAIGKAPEKNYYPEFISQIESIIPKGSSVFVSALPDPYFGLRNNYSIKEFSPVPIDNDTYANYLNKADYAVYNYFSSDLVEEYIINNYALVKEFNEPINFNVYIKVQK